MNRFVRLMLVVSLISLIGLSGSIPGARSAANSDFIYIAHPPNVQVSPNMVMPHGIPLCKSATLVNIVCYSPSFIRTAYNFPSNLDGTGQTILIVDAFGSPTIQSDLATFDSKFGIAPPPSFTIFCPSGCPTFDPNDTKHDEVGWTLETSLDVEYAHAMAPGAKIVLVVASTSSGNAINAAEAAAIKLYPGSIMSQSFGIPEIVVHGNNAQIMQAQKNFAAAQAAGITVFASAGDSGATNGFATANAGFPASSPLVTAVGGTMGNPYVATGTLTDCPTSAPGSCTTGLATYHGPCVLGRTVPPDCVPDGYGGEQVWNEPQFGAATGGAPSLFFAVPPYQGGLGLTARTTPDISYNAAVDGGVLVSWSVLVPGGLFIVGGTSAGSPQWAAIAALANQANGGPLGFINPALYKLAESAKYASDFHDITVGNNQLAGTPLGFSAGTGWDDATGWGTPNVANLVPDLVAAAHS